MLMNRRDFMRSAGAASTVGIFGINMAPVAAYAKPLRTQHTKETNTVCPYCSVGCGIIVHTINGKPVYTEGDASSPLNKGSLCSKGSAVLQLYTSKERLKYPLYRAAGSSEWKRVSWEWTFHELAKKVKKLRDATFTEKNNKGQTVNRTTAIASVGSAALDNEECYVYQKLLRALGLVYIEHQARI
ncbi:MAG: formate dehydrogenase [Desulfobulbaceae bacterium A2]|nr:MAG: formate dehydrogenase [Desulfobulbaceae bacterium A2]